MAHEPITPGRVFSGLLEENGPQAAAWIRGGTGAPYLSGLVKFYETFYGGVLIEAELFGLPDEETAGSAGFYAMHIHTSGSCAGPCGVCSQAGTSRPCRLPAAPALLSGLCLAGFLRQTADPAGDHRQLRRHPPAPRRSGFPVLRRQQSPDRLRRHPHG